MKKKYTIGELAQMSGLSIRTLQHYDNIGLLRAERSENGRRLYLESVLPKLEQVLFYRNLGFSLSEIKENLVDTTTLTGKEAILSKQATLLQNQIESRHTSLAVIEACREVNSIGKEPPWSFLAA